MVLSMLGKQSVEVSVFVDFTCQLDRHVVYYMSIVVYFFVDFRVKEGSKLGRTLEADIHNKMEIKFVVREASSGNAITVHQAFIAFVHKETKQEIIFVSTPDQQNVYTFDVVCFQCFFQAVMKFYLNN